MAPSDPPPILRDKHYDAPSAFTPNSILREARRQKGLVTRSVPPICVLDPDGDMREQLAALRSNILIDRIERALLNATLGH